jgi:hypothetical protein
MHQVQCERHGLQEETFVCQHVVAGLRAGLRVGFWWSTQRDVPRPDAWCTECNRKVADAGGEWTSDAEAFASPKILCGECYDDARRLNLGETDA